MKNQWGTMENAGEELLMLLASNADTLAQNDLKRQLDSVEERLTAIKLGHREYFSEMSSTIFANDRLVDRLNCGNNRVSSAAGSVQSREELTRNLLERTVDHEEQRHLEELEMKERRTRREK